MDALKQIPPVNDVLSSQELSEFRHILGQPFAGATLNQVLSEIRRDLTQSNSVVSRADLTSRIAREVARRLRDILQPSLRRVINASGVILHTNLGRAPLPETAIEHLREVSIGYSNLEFDLQDGSRGKRDVHVERTLQLLLGCEAAIVVNNNAAAVLLVLNTIGEGGEVVASRGEQIEIGGSFRIPEVMAKAARACARLGQPTARGLRIMRKRSTSRPAFSCESILAISESLVLRNAHRSKSLWIWVNAGACPRLKI